jgi:hypothetical protein
LAKAAGDHFYAGVFLRQLCHDRDEFFAAYYDDIHHLKEEDQKSLVDLAGKRWLKTRSLSFSLGTDAEGNDLNFITAFAGSLDHEILALNSALPTSSFHLAWIHTISRLSRTVLTRKKSNSDLKCAPSRQSKHA